MVKCRTCNGTGEIEIDSGGFDMADQPISLGSYPCPACRGREAQVAWKLARIRSLQETRDYAAPELIPSLDAQIAQLIAEVEDLDG